MWLSTDLGLTKSTQTLTKTLFELFRRSKAQLCQSVTRNRAIARFVGENIK